MLKSNLSRIVGHLCNTLRTCTPGNSARTFRSIRSDERSVSQLRVRLTQLHHRRHVEIFDRWEVLSPEIDQTSVLFRRVPRYLLLSSSSSAVASSSSFFVVGVFFGVGEEKVSSSSCERISFQTRRRRRCIVVVVPFLVQPPVVPGLHHRLSRSSDVGVIFHRRRLLFRSDAQNDPFFTNSNLMSSSSSSRETRWRKNAAEFPRLSRKKRTTTTRETTTTPGRQRRGDGRLDGRHVGVFFQEIFSKSNLCNGSVYLGFHYSAFFFLIKALYLLGDAYTSLSLSLSLVVLALVRDHLSFFLPLSTRNLSSASSSS